MTRISNAIPMPIKAVAWMGGITAAFFFISLPAIIVFGPPLILGGMWYGRRLKRLARELHDARWSNMGSYHLGFVDEPANTARDRIPSVARSRVLRALENNEQGFAGLILGQDAEHASESVVFTPVELVEQDFRAGSSGFQQRLELRRYGLAKKGGSRIANVTVVLHSDVLGKGQQRMRIELASLGYRPKTIVLDAPSQDSSASDVIIDVTPKKNSHSRDRTR